MRSAAIKLAVFASAVLLALPVGWCRTLPGHCPAEQAHAAMHCCPESSQTGCDSENVPAAPEASCCCTPGALPPSKAVDLPDGLGVCLIALPSDLVAATCSQAAGVDLAPVAEHSGPPLRVLHCVWRC